MSYVGQSNATTIVNGGYIGASPINGAFSKLDDIKSGFNDSTTTFNLTEGSVAVRPINAQNLVISIDGVIQEPGSAYTVAGTQITFTEAPNTNATFFGVRLGSVGAVSGLEGSSVTEGTIAADAVTTSKIADRSVLTTKIGLANVTSSLIGEGNVTVSKLADANNSGIAGITSSKIEDGNIITSKIADANVTTAKLSPNLIFQHNPLFMGAVLEKANVIAANVGGATNGDDINIIDIDKQNNGVLFFTANSHSNTVHTVNFLGLKDVAIGNTINYVVMLTNNVDSQANISNVQIMGSEAKPGNYSDPAAVSANNLLFLGNPRGTGIEGTANIDVYSFSVIKRAVSGYTVICSKSNFT